MARTRQEIRDALSDLLYRVLTEGVIVTTDEGTPVQLTPPAQYITAAVAFIKGEEATPERPVPKNTSGLLKEFEKKLPFGPKAVQ